ncbi:general secretion pathway protein GspK [Lysobacter sp. D1-1-M9]|uniref:general secretion pathway protein GspK n=1 Tax=Novilysobacter longmucuonensis TaxID=3098603 RepID=UPI002FC789FE
MTGAAVSGVPVSGGRVGNGFVLIMVLAILVILSLLASTVAVISQRLREEQLQRQRQLQAQIDMASTRATVLYLLASQRMTFGGVTVDERVVLSADERVSQRGEDELISLMPVGNELALEGSPYSGLGDIAFALQDDRGLLGINWTSPAMLQGLVAQAEGDSPAVATLQNLLLDYQDADDLYRLNSAEREQYQSEGRAPPSNRVLATPMELRRVIGWDDALGFLDDAALSDTVTVSRNPRINVNTAPLTVLQALPGVDEAMAQRVVDYRKLQPFVNLTSFYQLLGTIPADDELLSLYPSQSGTLKLWSPLGGTVQVLHWTLTPYDDGGRPWREDYEFTLPQDGTSAAAPARTPEAEVFAEPAAQAQ